jgi:hypothetical protein
MIGARRSSWTLAVADRVFARALTENGDARRVRRTRSVVTPATRPERRFAVAVEA